MVWAAGGVGGEYAEERLRRVRGRSGSVADDRWRELSCEVGEGSSVQLAMVLFLVVFFLHAHCGYEVTVQSQRSGRLWMDRVG